MLTAVRAGDRRWRLVFLLMTLALMMSSGCFGIWESTPEEFARFEQAGPCRPAVDTSAIVLAKLASGPYRVASGDILQFDMPAVMRALSGDPAAVVDPHLSRVTREGKVTLPILGEIEAAGRTLGEIESEAVEAYYPRFSVHRPAIVATVMEYDRVKVSVVGAVVSPGVYGLASDEQSLVGALMKAGGINSGRVFSGTREGARAVRIRRPEDEGDSEPILLPVEDLNIVFADVALEGGETIEVLTLNPEFFTILGLVNREGNYDYPYGTQFTLLDAIGFGGGLDLLSKPQLIQIFRQAENGEIVSATYDIEDEGLARAAAVKIKPGDIISVAETTRTFLWRLLDRMYEGSVNFRLTWDVEDRLLGPPKR